MPDLEHPHRSVTAAVEPLEAPVVGTGQPVARRRPRPHRAARGVRVRPRGAGPAGSG